MNKHIVIYIFLQEMQEVKSKTTEGGRNKPLGKLGIKRFSIIKKITEKCESMKGNYFKLTEYLLTILKLSQNYT